MVRIRGAFVSGTILNNPLAIGDTSLSSAALSSLPTVTSPDIAALVLDPVGVGGVPECVWVTAHTAAATTATISRAAEGTTARAHGAGISWVHGPTIYDIRGTMPEYVTYMYRENQGFTSLGAFGTNVAYLTPMQALTEDVLLTSLVNYIVTSSGNIDLGMYSTTDGASFTRVVSLGSTASPGTGTQEFTALTDTPLYRGTRYYFAYAANNNTIRVSGIANLTTAIAIYNGYSKAASFPLPSTLTVLTQEIIAPEMVGRVSGGFNIL